MAALVDLDLNCCPPSPEEPRLAMLTREQPFPDQMNLHKMYGSFWNQFSGAESSLHSTSTHEHKLMSFAETSNPNPHVSSSFKKRKTQSNVAEKNALGQNLDVRSSAWRKPDMAVPEKRSYHDVIDLEKLATSDDVSEIVSYSSFGNVANHMVRSQVGSCCVSLENGSLAEPCHQHCKEPNSFRLSPGSVGSSESRDYRSPNKPRNAEPRHSLIDLNEPQEKSLHVFLVPSEETYSPLFHSSSQYLGDFSKSYTQVFRKECGSGIGSLKESSSMMSVPSSAANSSRYVAATFPVQREGLIDLNVPLESTDMLSEMINNRGDKLANEDGSKGAVSYHFHSKTNNLQAETHRESIVVRNNHMLAGKEDNNMLHPIPSTNCISTAQSEFLKPETHLVDNHVQPPLGVSYDGPSNSHVTVSMLRAEAEGDDKAVATAAETLISIFSDNFACTVDFPGNYSQTSAQDGNYEIQCSLDSFEKIVLNLEEVIDDGQSIPVISPDMNGPSCGIKLKRGRGMRNFQREIIPGLVSLARQEICDDLHAIGYEPKNNRSRKTRRGQRASTTRSRPRKRSAVARN